MIAKAPGIDPGPDLRAGVSIAVASESSCPLQPTERRARESYNWASSTRSSHHDPFRNLRDSMHGAWRTRVPAGGGVPGTAEAGDREHRKSHLTRPAHQRRSGSICSLRLRLGHRNFRRRRSNADATEARADRGLSRRRRHASKLPPATSLFRRTPVSLSRRQWWRVGARPHLSSTTVGRFRATCCRLTEK